MESQMRINPPIMDVNKTSPRHADIWSHPGHYRVAVYTSSWSQKGHGHGHEWPRLFIANWPSYSRDRAVSKFDLENPRSKVIAKVKPDDCICCLEFNRNVCFSFHGSWTIFGWGLEVWQISYLTRKILGRGHGQGQISLSRSRPRVQCLLFVSWLSDHLWLRYSKFHIWPWKFNSRSSSTRKSTKIWSGNLIYRCRSLILRKMKGIRKVVQKLSREQMSVVGGGGDGSGAYEPAQKHKVTPGMPGYLIIQLWVSKIQLWKLIFQLWISLFQLWIVILQLWISIVSLWIHIISLWINVVEDAIILICSYVYIGCNERYP